MNFKKYGKTGKKIIIGWVGGISTAKYLSVLKYPLQRLGLKYDIIFKIYGLRGQNYLIPKIRNITFDIIDWIEPDKLPAEISSFDIGVMPLHSTDWEKGKCPTKAIEYMSMEIPAVCSAVGEINYIINNGVNGFLYKNPKDWIHALEKLINNEDLRIKIGKNGRKRVIEEFSIEINGAKLANILKNKYKD